MGQAISRAYAASGADVCLISRKLSDVEALADEIQKLGVRAFAIQGDVSDSKEAGAATHQAIEKLGGVDILVCAAGFPFDPGLWNKSLYELEDEDFVKVFNTDVMGSFRAAKVVIPEMVQQKSGVVILFSSTPADIGVQ